LLSLTSAGTFSSYPAIPMRFRRFSNFF
jgi:hypothetical protein